jgi:hypothetical protein
MRRAKDAFEILLSLADVLAEDPEVVNLIEGQPQISRDHPPS